MGGLSRLVRLEELHVANVEECNCSTLRDLESLSKLTALTIIKCAGDVIHSNLGLSSKLTRYTIKVSEDPSHHDPVTSVTHTYDRIMDLVVYETTPLGDWIRHMLRKSEFVRSFGNGSKNVLTELQLDGVLNVKDLRLYKCVSVEHILHTSNCIPFPELQRLEVEYCNSLQYIFCRTHTTPKGKMVQVIKFPNLHDMRLGFMECFTHFCNDAFEGIEFPQLRILNFCFLRQFKNFWPTANNRMLTGNSFTNSNPLFNEKVSCPNLEELKFFEANSITAVCSHQLPTGYFSKLEKLEVIGCGKLRNLMSPSVARGVLNLQILDIRSCGSMEEVITKEELGEEMTDEYSLFPHLEKLNLCHLPKLSHFFLTKHVLEFPFLGAVVIHRCPEMRTFILGSVSTPSLGRVFLDPWMKDYVEVKDDLNKTILQLFNSKEQEACDGHESAAS